MKAPNILILFTDDQRFDTIGALGNPYVHTPHMDSLVQGGCSFDRCHIMGGTTGAVCMASRAMLHTGRGLFELQNKGSRIPEDHRTLGETLKTRGYRCYGTGKWHNGGDSYTRSFHDGGSVFFGGMTDHWHVPCYEYNAEADYSGSPQVRQGCHSTIRITEEAVSRIKAHRGEEPFFMYVSYLAPHDPRTMPEEYRQRQLANLPPLPENFMEEHPFDHGDLGVRDELLADLPRRPQQIREHLAEYYAMIDHLDHNIGRILKTLEDLGERENTLIVLAGDNGLALGQHGLMGKQSCYDHSLRVPLIFNGPGVPAAARRQQLCYLHEIYPSLCEAVGADIPDSVSGKSLWNSLQQDAPHRDSLYCGYRDRIRCHSRDDGWKLILSDGLDGQQREQLYFLPKDPLELNNLAADPGSSSMLQELRSELMQAAEAAGEDLFPLEGWQGQPA